MTDIFRDSNSGKTTPMPAEETPVVRIQTPARSQPDPSLSALFDRIGWTVESVKKAAGIPGDETALELGPMLTRHVHRWPGRPLLLIRGGLDLSEATATEMLDLLRSHNGVEDSVVVVTVLSNSDPGLNPFAGLEMPSGTELAPRHWENLVSLLGPGLVHQAHMLPQHLLLFSSKAAERLAQSDVCTDNALDRLKLEGGRLLLADNLFVFDPDSEVAMDQPLAPHEQRRPPAWALLCERLDRWLFEKELDLSEFRNAEKPLTLHITHSWGGGVEQWVKSFIDADEVGLNCQLRSEGPQSGDGAGQRLSLYLENRTQTAIGHWWLQPPIRSTDQENEHYRSILSEICHRYGVGRIIVSSLVGHSLDALTMALPTIEVLHDFYPCWPLLDIHPVNYLGDDDSTALQRALTEQSLLPDFRGRDAASWKSLAERWHRIVSSHDVALAAPSHSVTDLLRRLDPDWMETDIEIIPHGLPQWCPEKPVLPRKRDDGRLRLLIPGSMSEGKGQALLLEALPELTPIAQLYLVGAGKNGEVFFGRSGVNVLTSYRRDELPEILAAIGPDLAALLSIVPETFSYTLSEMLQLNIPVIATRVGSFKERISEGRTGWLIEPDKDSLVIKVRQLAQHRNELKSIQERLPEIEHPGTDEMVLRYQQLCAARPIGRKRVLSPDLRNSMVAERAAAKMRLGWRVLELEQQSEQLQREVERRTAWAEEREQALKQEQQEKARWVAQLTDSLEQLKGALEHEQDAHALTQVHLSQLEKTHDWVLSSSSWRVTRPFRVARRMGTNFMLAHAWNPMRWPLLLSQLERTIRTQGLRGALMRSQLGQQQPYTPSGFETGLLENIGDPDPPRGFTAHSAPEVSIVVPAYNQWLYTAACLRSLKEAACRTTFEVIVVDDESSDETAERLADVDGLNLIRNPKNLGFIGSCNKGVEQARGEYLVLLNNDIQVMDGWLDALLDTFKRFPDTGLAGARLLYPDGSLQEAGGIVFSDGSGWNYGRGDDPERPEYQYMREVDYCSGACIALATDLFSEMGGFDDHYAPAYYEDTDLAFRIRARGLKVRIQPRAQVVHHEGVTSGTDTSGGIKRFQLVNRDRFRERWQDELCTYPAPLSDAEDNRAVRKARDHRLKGRILVIDAYTPEPDQDSGSLRLRHLLNCFSDAGYGLTFFADNREHAGVYTTDMQQAGVEVIYNPWLQSLHGFFNERGREFDYVMVSRHYVAVNYLSLIERYCPDTKFIFDTVDLHYLREQRLAELKDSLPLHRIAAQTKRSELTVIAAADATLVVSSVEKTVLERDAPGAKVHVISNVHEVVGRRRSFDERKDLFFVGGYQHPPNVDAAIWFVGSIWPSIRKELPDVRFHLIGSKATDQIRALHGDGVHFHGFVKDLDPWLDGCRLAVAPLRYGAGVKGKVNISMSRGQPVVATSVAAEGLFAKPGQDILIADAAADFAAEVVRAYRDRNLWNRVSEGGLENVRKYFSVDTARRSLQELLRSLQ